MATFITKEKAHEAGVLSVAISDIHDELTLERIRFRSGCRVVPEQHSEAEIRQMLRARSHKDSDSLLQSLASQAGRESSWESEPIINLGIGYRGSNLFNSCARTFYGNGVLIAVCHNGCFGNKPLFSAYARYFRRNGKFF